MAYVNDPTGYRALVPREEHIAFDHTHERVIEEEGLYYRTATVELESANQTLLLTRPRQATVTGYQYWAERGWKAEHGTMPAVKRFNDKSFEEYAEVCTAVADYQDGRKEDPKKRKELISELGDLAFCITANASNSAADLDAGMKNTLFEYVMGIQHFRPDGSHTKSSWRDYAARLATEYNPLRIGQIDHLIRQGFEPTPSAIMNIDIDDDDQFNDGVFGHLMVLRGRLASIRRITEEQYGYDALNDQIDPDLLIMPEFFRGGSRLISEEVARSLLEISFIGRQLADLSLASILRSNVMKVNGRVSAGLVDKTDGDRPPELI